MSENYIVINGKKTELTEEQLEKLGIKTGKKYEEMFEREPHGCYYCICSEGNLNYFLDVHETGRNPHYCVGNYCKDKDIMTQRALHESLNRLLWRASIKAGELDNKWNMSNPHYYIYRDFDSDCLRIDHNDTWKNQDTCYFPTEDSAHDALEKIVMPFLKEHPNFVW